MEQLSFEQLPSAVSKLYEKLSHIEQLLKTNNTSCDAEQLLTIEEAAEFLRLTKPTLYGYVSRKEIPVCKKGKRLYFSKQELTNWVKAGKKTTVESLKVDAVNTLLNNPSKTK